MRYPRGEAYDGLKEYRQPISVGKSEWIYRESEIALVALGSMVKTAEKVHAALRRRHSCKSYQFPFCKAVRHTDVNGGCIETYTGRYHGRECHKMVASGSISPVFITNRESM